MMPRKNHYELLEIPSNADSKTIKRAYRRMVRLYHPDTGTSSLVSPERFQEIIEAYNVLRDPVKRAHYDRIVNRPSIRIMESEWVYQPSPTAGTSSRPKTSTSHRPPSTPRPNPPQRKTVAHKVSPYLVFPLLLVVASLILFGVFWVTNNLVQPDSSSLATTVASVEQVQTYVCGRRDICYYVTYGYQVDGAHYQGSFTSQTTPYFVGTAVEIHYHVSNPATSTYTPIDERESTLTRDAALVVLVIVMIMGGSYFFLRGVQHDRIQQAKRY